MKKQSLSIIACTVLAASSIFALHGNALAQGSICKWQDEKGKWHISSVPPDAHTQCGKARSNSLETVPREVSPEVKDKSNMSLGEAFVATQKRQKELEKKYIAGTATPEEIREYEVRKEKHKDANAKMEAAQRESRRQMESTQPLKCKRALGSTDEYECTR